MFRLLWLTFFGRSRMTPEVEHHVHESPVSMTGVLVVLAVLSAIGGFLSIPHFLEPLLPMPDVVPALEHFETPLLVVSIVLAFAGLAAAAYLYGGDAARAERLHRRFPTLHRVLSGKYFVDEAYDALHRAAAVLDLGSRLPAARRPDALRRLAARSRRARTPHGRRASSRVQNGNLHLYALLVLVGIIASLAWSWRHV